MLRWLGCVAVALFAVVSSATVAAAERPLFGFEYVVLVKPLPNTADFYLKDFGNFDLAYKVNILSGGEWVAVADADSDTFAPLDQAWVARSLLPKLGLNEKDIPSLQGWPLFKFGSLWGAFILGSLLFGGCLARMLRAGASKGARPRRRDPVADRMALTLRSNDSAGTTQVDVPVASGRTVPAAGFGKRH